MQLETSYLEYDGAKMMVGYALIKNQKTIIILTEGKHDSQLRFMIKERSNGISRLSLDTFKTALAYNNKLEDKNLEQTNICLTWATHPNTNKLYFRAIDHRKDLEVSNSSISLKEYNSRHNLSVEMQE
jgi:hypothetical protein